MSDAHVPNENEGADPSDDIRKQNPGETTTADLAERSGKGDHDLGAKDKKKPRQRQTLTPGAPLSAPRHARNDRCALALKGTPL